MINLLSNAVKYTPVGGRIGLSLDEKLSSESGVGCFEFTVEDNGIGMAPEFIDRLFMPLSGRRTRESPGSREPGWDWPSRGTSSP